MSLILDLIAKFPYTVLCEYTEYQGNFLQISRLVLQKVKPESKYSITHDK